VLADLPKYDTSVAPLSTSKGLESELIRVALSVILKSVIVLAVVLRIHEHCSYETVRLSMFFFLFFLVAPTRGSVLPFRSIGLILLSFLIRTVGRTPWTGD
jgi:hypothetical protein